MKKVLKSKLYLIKENESYLFCSHLGNAVFDYASNEVIAAIAVIEGEELSLEFEFALSGQLIKPEELAKKGINFDAKYEVSALSKGSEERIYPVSSQVLSEALMSALMGAANNPDLWDWRVEKIN